MTSILLKSFKLVASTSTYTRLVHFYINPYYTLALNKTDNSSGVRPSSWSLFILWKKSCARFFSFNRYNILRGSTLWLFLISICKKDQANQIKMCQQWGVWDNSSIMTHRMYENMAASEVWTVTVHIYWSDQPHCQHLFIICLRHFVSLMPHY